MESLQGFNDIWADRKYILEIKDAFLQQVTVPQPERLPSSSNKSVVPSDETNAVADVLENTLWNRQLGAMSEEIVAALVCQIFEGKLEVDLS